MGLLIRWICAFVLLAATFNPTDLNYVRWAQANHTNQLPLVILIGLLLTVAYIIYLRATLRSIGLFGILLILAIFAALLLVLFDWGVLSLNSGGLLTWLGLLALSLVLGIGLGWSHVRRSLSGQSDMDNVDE